MTFQYSLVHMQLLGLFRENILLLFWDFSDIFDANIYHLYNYGDLNIYFIQDLDISNFGNVSICISLQMVKIPTLRKESIHCCSVEALQIGLSLVTNMTSA